MQRSAGSAGCEKTLSAARTGRRAKAFFCRKAPQAAERQHFDQDLPTSKMAPFFGWCVVVATFVLAIFGWGVGFYGPPIYLQLVVQRTGWSVALVSTAVTLHFLVGAAVVANLPRLYRLMGIPVVTVTGAVLLAVGVVGWSIAGLAARNKPCEAWYRKARWCTWRW
ncbi:hypothetical protein AM571_CH01952 [Rhizobium etli 8C-3]|uniref:Uncharacterized protein n=2 Tax=Rhizobium etli TaxID=29449 RepID=A0A1L5P3P8_RHIET|nr:hypothetical protein AM571_CH01952 [Rhizobium etli 8C-3]